MDTRTIYSRYKRWAVAQPDAAAVITDSRTVSYRELDRMAEAILQKLYAQNAMSTTVPDGTPNPIGIVMSHSPEMIAAILGVLKSGAAYVPAEPSLPKGRIDYMMETARVSAVIDDEFCRNLPEISEITPDLSKPADSAYILYTSGTTGKPKGVIVENRSVVNYAEAFEAEFHTAPGDVMLQFSICSFDIFVEEVFTTLLNGAGLAIPSAEVHDGNVEGLMDFCTRHGVTEISGFPYLLADMNRHKVYPPHLRLLISGGDVIRARYITWLKDRPFVICNTYGPSETTVCATYYRVDNAEPLDDGTYPIGKAIKGVQVAVVDDNLVPVPAGRTGEIVISGEGVSAGYLGNPPEQANFLTLPDGSRLYRSGDLGYVLPDGNLGFLRRKDAQVMILGRRVEPSEVENVLNESPCVERAVVRAYTDEEGLSYLVAYFVPSHKDCSLRTIREYLNSKLADFMVPEFFVKMDEIPLTPRGKVDTKALPVVMKEGVRN